MLHHICSCAFFKSKYTIQSTLCLHWKPNTQDENALGSIITIFLYVRIDKLGATRSETAGKEISGMFYDGEREVLNSLCFLCVS